MRRPGIGTLALFVFCLVCAKAALANLAESATAEGYTVGNPIAIEQIFQDLGGFGEIASQEKDADGLPSGNFLQPNSADRAPDAAGMIAAFNSDINVANWIVALATTHRIEAGGALDDATGRHGLLDSGGTVATLNDPRGGGGTVTIGINSSGQIVGNVYNWTRANARGLSPEVDIADVPGPSPLPFLAGCLPVLVIASRWKRKR